MTVSASCVWEIRSAGSIDNGGGYVGGGTDYSQQNAAQESYTTLAMTAATTTLTCSGADTFHANIVGNIIKITGGTNFVAAWYEVTARASSTSITIDRDATTGSNASSGTGNMGGAVTIVAGDAFWEQMEPGQKAWVAKDATYNFTATSNVAKDGTALNPIEVEGYQTTRGDEPFGTNRPLFATSTLYMAWGDFWRIKHIRGQGSASSRVLSGGADTVFVNCWAYNLSGTAGRDAFQIGSAGYLIQCEGKSDDGTPTFVPNGPALMASSTRVVCIGCYLHDSTIGIDLAAQDDAVVIACILAGCTTAGIDATGSGANRHRVLNSTFYNNGIGVSVNNGSGWLILGNIFDANATGVKWTTWQGTNYLDYNCWDNTTDVSGPSKGPHAVTGDPGLTAPGSDDFTLGSGSNCLDAGLSLDDLQDLVGSYKINIGVDQDDVAAGGGGLITHPGMAGGMRG